MKILKALIALVMASTILASCGGNSIVGIWASEDEGDFEFFSDGTFDADGESGTYVVDGNRLKLTDNGGSSETFDIKINGDTLTIYEEDEEEGLVLTRK